MTCHFCGRGGKGDWVNAGGDVGPAHRECFSDWDRRQEALENTFRGAPVVDLGDLTLVPVRRPVTAWLKVATEMRLEGATLRSISQALGYSTSYVDKILSKIPVRNPLELKHANRARARLAARGFHVQRRAA